MDQKVTLGRTVHYRETTDRVYAAIVSDVVRPDVGVVHLTVFDPETGPRTIRNVSFSGTEAIMGGCWGWPPRV